MPESPIADVLNANTDFLMGLPGVVGIGEGRCGGVPCIRVFVTEISAELTRRLPKTISGYLLEVDESGPIQARR